MIPLTTSAVLIILAAICFLAAALGANTGRLNLVAFGLFLFMVSLLFVHRG